MTGAKVSPIRPPLNDAQRHAIKFAYAELERVNRALMHCTLAIVGVDEVLMACNAPADSPLLPGPFQVSMLAPVDQVDRAMTELRRAHADVLFPGARAPAAIEQLRADVRADLDGVPT